MKKTKICVGLILIFMIFSLYSCAPKEYTGEEYGFFSGILHGFVFVFALIGKMFGANIGLYAEHNTGFFYWFGFILGLGGLGGGGAAARR